MPKKRKKRKKSDTTKAKERAWNVFSEYIRRRDADRNGYVVCVTCKTNRHWKKMHAGHFVAGRGNSILFDEKGVHAQCVSCNIFNGGKQLDYFYYMEKRYGRKEIDRLYALKNKPMKITKYEFDDIAQKYTKLIEQMDKESET